MTQLRKFPSQRDSNPGSSAPKADTLTTRPARQFTSKVQCDCRSAVCCPQRSLESVQNHYQTLKQQVSIQIILCCYQHAFKTSIKNSRAIGNQKHSILTSKTMIWHQLSSSSWRSHIAVSAWYLALLEDALWPCASDFSPLGFLSWVASPLARGPFVLPCEHRGLEVLTRLLLAWWSRC